MKKLTMLILCVCVLLSTSITAYANTGTEIESLLESDNPLLLLIYRLGQNNLK